MVLHSCIIVSLQSCNINSTIQSSQKTVVNNVLRNFLPGGNPKCSCCQHIATDLPLMSLISISVGAHTGLSHTSHITRSHSQPHLSTFTTPSVQLYTPAQKQLTLHEPLRKQTIFTIIMLDIIKEIPLGFVYVIFLHWYFMF